MADVGFVASSLPVQRPADPSVQFLAPAGVTDTHDVFLPTPQTPDQPPLSVIRAQPEGGSEARPPACAGVPSPAAATPPSPPLTAPALLASSYNHSEAAPVVIAQCPDPGSGQPHIVAALDPVAVLPTSDACSETAQAGSAIAPLDLGPGFPSAPAPPESVSLKLHDWWTHYLPRAVSLVENKALEIVSSLTKTRLGMDVSDLVNVERVLYRMLRPSRDGYVGGAPPIFQALSQGQAAYVYIEGREKDSADLTRYFSGLPHDVLLGIGPGRDDLTAVRKAVLDRIAQGQFPVYVSASGKTDRIRGTDIIANESISSIARQQNALSGDFPDPTAYYRWLVTRVSSNWQHIDPWLSGVKPDLHRQIETIKGDITPPWVQGPSHDPLGSIPRAPRTDDAYARVMAILGNGRPPDLGILSDFADTALGLDRDLLQGVQTYWVKLLSEVGAARRESLFTPLARSWVTLNTIPPADPHFCHVSPDNAPYIQLADRSGTSWTVERYDRSAGLGEVLNHTLDGLGFAERRKLMDVTLATVRANADAIRAREEPLRTQLGCTYGGLDVDGILSGRLDANNPTVKQGLEQLHKALGDTSLRYMSPSHAEILRHYQMLEWVATSGTRYPDVAMELAPKLPCTHAEPLMVGEFWRPDHATPVSRLARA